MHQNEMIISTFEFRTSLGTSILLETEFNIVITFLFTFKNCETFNYNGYTKLLKHHKKESQNIQPERRRY